MITISSGAEHRLREMIRQQRVDILELRYNRAGATFETARRACEQCASADACLVWLESNEAGRAPEFCPIRRLFARFRAS